MLTFGGAFSAFTYFRPFLEQLTRVSLPQLSLLLCGLGLAGFVGTRTASAMVERHLYPLLGLLPLLLALLTVGLLLTGSLLWPVAMLLMLWGLVNAAIPVCWSAWMAQGVAGEAERTGGLMVAPSSWQSWVEGRLAGPARPVVHPCHISCQCRAVADGYITCRQRQAAAPAGRMTDKNHKLLYSLTIQPAPCRTRVPIRSNPHHPGTASSSRKA
jgi:hypothetical protein